VYASQLAYTCRAADARGIVTVNQDVIKYHGARRHRFDMVLDGGQSQSKVQLIASAVAQPVNGYLFPVLPDCDHDGLVIIREAGGQAAMISQGENRKQLTRALQNPS